jgi:hypothetical protein
VCVGPSIASTHNPHRTPLPGCQGRIQTLSGRWLIVSRGAGARTINSASAPRHVTPGRAHLICGTRILGRRAEWRRIELQFRRHPPLLLTPFPGPLHILYYIARGSTCSVRQLVWPARPCVQPECLEFGKRSAFTHPVSSSGVHGPGMVIEFEGLGPDHISAVIIE